MAGFRLFVIPMALWPPTFPLSVTPGFVFIPTFLPLNKLTPPLKILFLVAFLLSSLATQAALVALEGTALEKSPGSDGLPVEFYRAFWHILGSDLVDVLSDSFSAGSLPPSLRSALISGIFKKGDRLNCKNWRPISLLNVDYKLCAQALVG